MSQAVLLTRNAKLFIGDYVESIYWSGIETYVSLIVPCLPAVRALLSQKLPRVFGMDTTRGSGNSYIQSGPADSFAMSSKTTKTPSPFEDHGAFLKSLTTNDKNLCQVSAARSSRDLSNVSSSEEHEGRTGIMVIKETKVHDTI